MVPLALVNVPDLLKYYSLMCAVHTYSCVFKNVNYRTIVFEGEFNFVL